MKLQTKIKIIRWVEKLLKTEIPVSMLTKPVEISYQNFPIVKLQSERYLFPDEDNPKIIKAFAKETLLEDIKNFITYSIRSGGINPDAQIITASIWIVDRRNQKPVGEITQQNGDRSDIYNNISHLTEEELQNIKNRVHRVVEDFNKTVLQDKNKEPLDTPPDNE